MIQKLLAVALGGSIGAVLRYIIFYFFEKTYNHTFPWSTLIVNLAGSFLICLLWGVFDKFYVSPGMRLFLFSGMIGSFTKFSTFAFDVFSLGKDGSIKYLILYISATNILGIALAIGGFYLSKIN